MKLRFRPLSSLLTLLVLFTSTGAAQAPKGTDILWDTWGVPHIFAETDEGAFYAYGWAQAKNHGELILKLYAQARGEAAEHYGEAFLESDRAMYLIRAPERAQAWLGAQRPAFREKLERFADGFNAYVTEHPDEFSETAQGVLPVAVTDLLAHTIRDLSLFISAECGSVVPGLSLGGQPGSNGWAISPSRSESGNAMLLANPHLGWEGVTLFFEAQLQTPDTNRYGATLVGIPVPTIAFNDRLGWTHTTNTYDGCDMYALTLKDDGYLLDGEMQPFETETHTLQVREADGSFTETSFEIKRSVHGAVVQEQGTQALAIRMVGVDVGDYPGLLEQWWDMGQAQNLSDFEEVLERHQLPTQNVIYADADGQTMLLFAGRVPVRAAGDASFWRVPVPGDASELVWTKIHPYRDLPKTTNPEAGWVQNSNSAPWSMTLTGGPQADNFPAYFSPRGPINIREQRGIEMLMGDESMSFEDLVTYKHDTFSLLAERLLDDLLEVAKASDRDTVQAGAGVLERWDRQTKPDSRGAALFHLWFTNYVQASVEQQLKNDPSFAITEAVLYSDVLYSTPWQEENPMTTPDGLANPELAVGALEAAAEMLDGRLDLPWGEGSRMRFGRVDVPAHGGPGELGIFRVAEVALDTDGRYHTVWGDSYVAIVEFADPVRAQVMTTYGNSSQAASAHAGDQLELATQGLLRPVWRTRAEVEANLQERSSW